MVRELREVPEREAPAGAGSPALGGAATLILAQLASGCRGAIGGEETTAVFGR